MTPSRTEIEWSYQPVEFFEAPFRFSSREYELEIDGGKAVMHLSAYTDPLPSEVAERIGEEVIAIFRVRQLQLHRPFELRGPRVIQHLSSGQKSVAVTVGMSAVLTAIGQVDVVIRDSSGNITADSKRDRIAASCAMVKDLAPKVAKSQLLASLLKSYESAVRDPADEFTHLYEVRDALSQHFNGETGARNALGIAKDEWKRIGKLANAIPLEQSRHRGDHFSNHRPATQSELDESRAIIRNWIAKYANTL